MGIVLDSSINDEEDTARDSIVHLRTPLLCIIRLLRPATKEEVRECEPAESCRLRDSSKKEEQL